MNIVCLVCVLQQYLFVATFPEGTKELLWLQGDGIVGQLCRGREGLINILFCNDTLQL